MSDNRKVLLAKRKGDRNKSSNRTGHNTYCDQDIGHSRRGNKRPLSSCSTPKKNLANDRLKRLRSSLNEEVKKCPDEVDKNYRGTSSLNNKPVKISKCFNARKRPQSAFEEPVSIKLPRQQEAKSNVVKLNKNSFVGNSKCEPQKSIFTAATSSVLKEVKVSTDDIEDMEWSTADDDLTCTVANPCPTIGSDNAHTSNNTISDKKFKNHYFIVVDTNIFLSHLQIIRDVITMNIPGNIKPVVYIPWIVIEELDFIKEDSSRTSLKLKAQEAIKYVEKILSSKHERMMGQTLNEANEQKSSGKGQDNKIIGCCLQVQEKYQHMVLLTSDINLKNKAHVNNIPVCSHNEIMAKVKTLNQTKAEIILNKMATLCSTIISECAKKAYGVACKKMPICQSPPKSIQDCITIFTKYWFPVFEEVLMKQFKKSIDDLSVFLTDNTAITNDSNELNDLLRLCVRVCLFLKDVECCKDIIENTIRDLNNIKEL